MILVVKNTKIRNLESFVKLGKFVIRELQIFGSKDSLVPFIGFYNNFNTSFCFTHKLTKKVMNPHLYFHAY